MSNPVDDTNASASTAEANDRTKHRAIGAYDDDAILGVGAGGELSADVVGDASASSSSGGKRKLAAESEQVKLENEKQQKLENEKQKLEDEKQKLQARLDAGVSEAVEVVIHSRIANIDARITSVHSRIANIQTDITAIRQRITASISAAPPLLTMDDVNAWLDANPLLVDEPTMPTSALWWKLGEKSLNARAAEWTVRGGFNVLVGVTGAGKTRSMYELLSRRFGFYWTMARRGNGGSSLVAEKVGEWSRSLANERVVDDLVRGQLIAYSILFLQWRRRFPNGTPLQWHVFQTTTEVVDMTLSSIVEQFLLGHFFLGKSSVLRLLKEGARVAGQLLLLVVDEAQELTRSGTFKSRLVEGALRSSLSPFARACYGATTLGACWFTGTSFSLRNAAELVGSAGGKPVDSMVFYADVAFDTVPPFRAYLRDMVCESISDALADELFARFRGRARPVAVLAEYLKASEVAELASADADVFRERLLDFASECESALLNRSTLSSDGFYSLVGAFIEHVNRSQTEVFVRNWLAIVKGMLVNPRYVVETDAAALFELGVGPLVATDVVMSDANVSVRSLNITEPLVPKILVAAALEMDPTGLKGMHPLVSVLDDIKAAIQPSMHGFLFEVLVVPIIHAFFVEHFGEGNLSPPGVLVHRTMLDGLDRDLRNGLSVFAPEHAAGPDAVHRFGRRGALGQVKFRASMGEAAWADAVRTVDRAQLYSEKPSDKLLSERAQKQRATRVARKAELRGKVDALLDELWPQGYCSYIVTLHEPPAHIQHRQMVDGRELFVFSPALCPTLFEKDTPGKDVWALLAAIKSAQSP